MVRKSKRLVASTGAVALGAMMFFAPTAANGVAQDFGNIDADRAGSLTVHKYLHQSGTASGDISEAPADGDFTNPVADVVFTAYPLIPVGESTPLDLTVPESWNGLANVTAGAGCTAPAGFTLGTPIVLPATDAAGVATQPLELTAYQVCETSAPANIVDTAAPFILTIPQPFENGWVYDVHAYPKNGDASITKTIEAQEGFGLGAPVRFPVTSAIPSMVGQEWVAYAISDQFDPALSPNPANGGISSVTADGVALDQTYYEIVTNGQNVAMVFTDAGIAALQSGEIAVGTTIEVIFDTIINELGAEGIVPNTANLWVNNPEREQGSKPPVPSPEVHTNWGSLEVLKRAANTTGSNGLLLGAQFEVYASNDPYAADCAATEPAGAAISVSGDTVFISDDNGVISVAGLFVSDSENPVIDADSRCYFLKEIAAPAGYVLPADPFTAVSVKIGETTTSDNVEILNTQSEVPELPLTGGGGTMLLIGTGIAGGLIALALVLLRRRETKSAANPLR